MGLDSVELVMTLEETFGVELKDQEVVQCVTPLLVTDLVFSKVQATDRKVCQSQRAFYVLRRALVRRFNLPRSRITLDMSFRDLLLPVDEARVWADLKSDVRARYWPQLARPLWMTWSLSVLAIVVFVAVTLIFIYGVPVGVANAFMLGIVALIAAGVVGMRRTLQFRTRIPSRYQRIRDLIPLVITSDDVVWTREQVSSLVKRIVVEQLGIPDAMYREDAHLVKDLGMDA
jgi:acyl carrier protein